MPIVSFCGHIGGRTALSLCGEHMFLTGSADQTEKPWDRRQRTTVMQFHGRDGFVPAVSGNGDR
jgi:hypothetical protein